MQATSSSATLAPAAVMASMPRCRLEVNRLSNSGEAKTYVRPSISMSNTSQAPSTTSATSLSAADSAHRSVHVWQMSNELLKPSRLLITLPVSNTLQPSTAPSSMVNVDSI